MDAESEWIPGATFALQRVLRRGREKWKVSLSLMVIGERKEKYRYEAMIMVWPPVMPSARSAELERGPLARLSAALRGQGYEGEWHDDAGLWGLFKKVLRGERALREEKLVLEQLDLSSALSAPIGRGRSNRRRA